MALKRVRTPHYIAGLGDGNVKVIDQKKSRDWTSNIRRRGPDPRLAAQEHPALLSSERFDQYFKELQEASSHRTTGRQRHAASPWHFSAWALLLTIILLGGFFLHILSDSKTYDIKMKRRRVTLSLRRAKKKTDEWNDDEDDNRKTEHLPSGNQNQDPAVDDTTTASSLDLYPYHTPEHGSLVALRERKPVPAANASSAAAGYPPPQATYQQSPLPFVAASPLAGTHHGSRSPGSLTHANRSTVNVAAVSPVPERTIGAHRLYQPPQRTTLNPPQNLSAIASFSNTTPDAERRLRTPRQHCDLVGRRISADTSRHASPALVARRPRESHLLLSPGHDDHQGPVDKVSPVVDFPQLPLPPPKFNARTDAGDDTPRIGHQRRVVAQSDALLPSIPDHSNDSNRLVNEIDSSNYEAFQFASPPVLRMQNGTPQSDESMAFPFLPTLPRYQSQAPPQSVNIDEMNLYQMMESGNVSHWEARVAEESRQLEDKVNGSIASDDIDFSKHGNAGAIASGTSDEIPSDDPRKGIKHTRTDWMESSNASSSLQGAIDFQELKLVDVIGGGGFGQVWRAIWNGTPVAVKILTGSAQSKNIPKPVLHEFIAEINLLRGMRHPNICLYMGACLDPPNRAIITELAANGSLWDALRLPLTPPYTPCDGRTRQAWPLRLYTPDARHGAPPGPSSRQPPPLPPRDTWPWELVKRVACGAARGMAYLHNGRPPVLHRDLKVSPELAW